MRRVVVFELNEVPWRVVDWWCAERPGSAIARLVSTSRSWTSVSPDEADLSPWITWPTVHRGVPDTVHGIRHFGQDTAPADEIAPPWWQTAGSAGTSLGLFGLLHTAPLPSDLSAYRFYVPDTFASDGRAHPPDLEPFQEFNLGMARASARNVSRSLDVGAATRFLASPPARSLRPTNAARLAVQLADERRRPTVRVRRRTFQAVVAFDVFEGYLRRTRPDAAAFFTNHVASAMHRYWAATFPQDYPAGTWGFTEEWRSRWEREIGFALARADAMVARLLAFARATGAVVVVVSSMGQRAAQGTPIEHQLVLSEPRRLLDAAGLAPSETEIRPAMVPQVNVAVASGARARLGTFLAGLAVGGAPVEWTEADGLFSVTFGQADGAIGAVTTGGVERSPASLGLEVIEVEDQVASTGYHQREGILVCHDPVSASPDDSRPVVPTTAVAPLLHVLLGLAPAPHHDVDALEQLRHR